jgi:hypothetical protein
VPVVRAAGEPGPWPVGFGLRDRPAEQDAVVKEAAQVCPAAAIALAGA